ncbi:MAG: PAS domain S-box protein [Phycisphaerae bacterium]
MATSANSKIDILNEIRILGEELIRHSVKAGDLSGVSGENNKYKLACILLDSFPHAVCIKDTSGRFLACNKAVQQLMQADSINQLIGKTEKDFIPDSEAQLWRKIEQDVLKTGQTAFDCEVPVTDKNGVQKCYLVTVVPVFDDSNRIAALIAVSLDATKEIQAIRNIDESERRYRTLFEGAAEGILMADVQTRRFYFANPAICKMLGYSESELKSLRVDDIHPKEEMDKIYAMFSQFVKEEKSTAIDIPFLCKDGSIKFFYGSSTTIALDARRYRVGFFTDMTKLKKTQQKLDTTQKHLQLIIDNSFDGISICEFHTKLNKRRLVFCNNKYVEMTGRSREELMAADNLNDFVSDRVNQKTKDYWYQCILKQIPFKGQTSWIRPDGKENIYEWAAAPVVIDGRYYIVGVDRDITEQIQKHKQLEMAEARYRTLVEQLPAILYVAALDENSTTLFISPQVETILGIKPQQYKVNPDVWRERLHPEDKDRVMKELVQAHSHEQPFSCEYRMINFSGKIVWFRDEASIVKDQNGKPLFLQGVMLDISDRKQAEHDLEQIKSELETRIQQRTIELEGLNKQLRSLAAELSLAEERTRRRIASDVHDNIGQNLALARIKLQSLAESSQNEAAKEELKNLSNLLTKTIESTRLLTFEISPPVLYELGFDSGVEWLLRQSRQRDRLITDFDTDGQTKQLDENIKVFLFQAVRELLINVAKHAKAKHVDVSIKQVDDKMNICVADDGTGFDIGKKLPLKENMATGFGLFSIRERIRLLNGSLAVESKPGFGTKIIMTVPLKTNGSKKRNKK